MYGKVITKEKQYKLYLQRESVTCVDWFKIFHLPETKRLEKLNQISQINKHNYSVKFGIIH